MGVLDRKAANRKKGVCEYSDLTRVSALKKNQIYGNMFTANQLMFRKKTGIFSYMYDSAIRNGGISLPFNIKS